MRLLILGTGGMAAAHAKAFSAMAEVEIAGCADVNAERAHTFAEMHGIPKAWSSLEDALAEGLFDAISNTTPDAVHFTTTMAALDAGLHVFCEKPLATNAAHAELMTRAAEAKGVINGVNLTYRNVAALQKAREIVAEDRLGHLRHFEAAYLQSWLTQPAWGDWSTEEAWLWRLSTRHGSTGALGDIGIHIFDFLSYAAGAPIRSIQPTLATFPKAPGNRIGPYILDANDSMMMTAQLSDGASGVIHATRFAPGHMNDLSLRLFGTRGGLEVTNTGALGTLRICEGADLPTATWRDVPLSPVETNYTRFVSAVKNGVPMDPDFRTALGLQYVIDAAEREATSGIEIDCRRI